VKNESSFLPNLPDFPKSNALFEVAQVSATGPSGKSSKKKKMSLKQ
jgi:hypothetical protein